ncbi:MAG: alpha-hydroxy acid oxidase [Egibacteraceae bacterium]
MVADELEQQARDRLTRTAYDYFAGGADDELTLADNVAAWRRLRLRPHVLRDVSKVSTETTVLGTPVAAPVLVAPMAYQRLAHDEGERATARGAAEAGTIMIVSTLSTVSLEDVAAAAPRATRWFQLYVRLDRRLTEELITRAVAAGYRALVFTVDVPVLGLRRRDERNRFCLPPGMAMANFGETPLKVDGSGLAVYTDDEIQPALTFADIERLSGLCDLPVLVKGVLRGDDARVCVDAGAAGIIVSNHGGRQLDTAIATADALPEIVDAVAGEAEVLVDGGIRRGTDIVKALALGAQAVLVGRPVLWGLTIGGADGVRAVLGALSDEFARALALCGTPSVGEVTPDLLASPPS